MWQAVTPGLIRRSHVFLLVSLMSAAPFLLAVAPPGQPWRPPIHIADLAAAGPLAFSPDGRTLASIPGPPKRGVLLWEVCSRQVRAELPDRPHEYYSLVSPLFTPDGRFLLTAVDGAYPLVRVWNLGKQTEADRLAVGQRVYGMSLSPRGRHVALVDKTGVSIWNTRTFEETKRLKSPPRNSYYSLAYRGDGKDIVVGTDDSLVRILRLGDSKVLSTFRGHGEAVLQVAASSDGTLIASASDRLQTATICLWNVNQGKRVARWKWEGGPTYLQFTPSGLLIAVNVTTAGFGEHSATVRFWDIAARREIREMMLHSVGVSGMALAPNGDLLAIGNTYSLTKVYRLTDPPFTSEPNTNRRAAPDSAAWKKGEPFWDALASPDAKKAFRAIWQLVESPKQAVGLLASKLSPAKAIDSKRWTSLIAQLDSDSFEKRETAELELRKLGAVTEQSLRRVSSARPSPEMRLRVDRLLKLLEGPLRDPERLREVRAVEALELVATKEARELLTWLSGGDPSARLTQEARWSLQRLSKRHATDVKEAKPK